MPNITTPQFGAKYITYEDGLFLTLYREEEVSSRIQRLKAIYPCLNTISDKDNTKQTALRFGLIQLHDHKGQLHILWRDQESFDALFHDVERIWNFLGEPAVSHFIGNGQALVREV